MPHIEPHLARALTALILKAAALANKSGVNTNTVYRMEGRCNQTRSVSERNIRKIAEACNVSAEWLMGASGSDNEPEFLSGNTEFTDDDTQRKIGLAAERLKQFRERKGISQQKLSNHTGVSLSMICAIEQGRDSMTADLSERISKHFDDITAEWLLFGEEFPVNNEVIEWLRAHKDMRIKIWSEIRKEKNNKSRSLYVNMLHFAFRKAILRSHPIILLFSFCSLLTAVSAAF